MIHPDSVPVPHIVVDPKLDEMIDSLKDAPKPPKHEPVDLELIEYFPTQQSLDQTNEVGVIKPTGVLINGTRVRVPRKSAIVIEPITGATPSDDPFDETGATARVTLTLYVRSLSVRGEVPAAA